MPTDTSGYPPEFAALLDEYNREVGALMTRLEGGSVSAAAWGDEMAGMLSKYAQAARMLGQDVTELLPDALSALSDWLDEQLGYLDGFETVVKTVGEYNSAWLPRAEMYGASTYTQYWEGITGDLPLPAMPAQGTQCRSNCKCKWDIQWIDRQAGDADCYWNLGDAEHCQTCLTRSEQWHPVRIRGGMLE